VLATYRLIAPGSEWRLHREWFGNSAMADLLGADFAWRKNTSFMPAHDSAAGTQRGAVLASVGRWRDLFNADFDVLLYDLTSTYFESTLRTCRKVLSAATATAATSGRTARRW